MWDCGESWSCLRRADRGCSLGRLVWRDRWISGLVGAVEPGIDRDETTEVVLDAVGEGWSSV